MHGFEYTPPRRHQRERHRMETGQKKKRRNTTETTSTPKQSTLSSSWGRTPAVSNPTRTSNFETHTQLFWLRSTALTPVHTKPGRPTVACVRPTIPGRHVYIRITTKVNKISTAYVCTPPDPLRTYLSHRNNKSAAPSMCSCFALPAASSSTVKAFLDRIHPVNLSTRLPNVINNPYPNTAMPCSKHAHTAHKRKEVPPRALGQ